MLPLAVLAPVDLPLFVIAMRAIALPTAVALAARISASAISASVATVLHLSFKDLCPWLLSLACHSKETLVGSLCQEPSLALARSIGEHLVLAHHGCAWDQVGLVAFDGGIVMRFGVRAVFRPS